MHPYNFGAMGSNLTKLLQVTCREAGMITWVQFFGGLPPLRIWEGKNRRKIGAILRNFALRSRISPKRMKISTSGKVDDRLRSLPRSMKKKLVKFGPRTKKLQWCMLTYPRSNYSNDYISAPRGRCRLKFFHALENDQGFLPHTPLGMGVPPQQFSTMNIQKLA